MPGASASHERATPLSLGVRVGLYAMLAALVIASFTVTPAHRPTSAVATAPSAAPTAASVDDDVARAIPLARSMARVRDTENMTYREPEAPPADTVDAPTPEPVATPAPTPRPVVRVVPATTATTAGAEARTLALMNASRAAGGLAPLAPDVGVADTARAHSAAEAQVRYVYHDGPDGSARSRNVPACGTGWYGENTGKVWNGNVDALHIEFMSEPWAPINHRTNIMDPNFRRVGVGAVMGPDAMYVTIVFCR